MVKIKNGSSRKRNGNGAQTALFEEDARESVVCGAGHKYLTVLPPADVSDTLQAIRSPVKVVMLDPWYNKGFGGVRDDYDEWLADVVAKSGKIAEHVYVWGFPEIIWRLLNNLPD
ncbi:MAG: hypothetical protein B7Z73_12200, partial [Planctomycetia bacterium 21-64-5]